MTSEINQSLSKLPARTVRALLQEMAELRQQLGLDGLDKLPLITLHLKSGKEFSGWLLVFGGDEQAKDVIMLHRHDLNTRALNDSDVLYLSAEQVEAITVHKAHRAAVRLAEEWKGPPPADVPTPSYEDSKRKAAELAQFVSKIGGFEISYEVDWEALPKMQGASFWLVEAMVEATGVLGTVLNNAPLKEKLAANLKTLKFIPNQQPSVQRDGSTLTLGVALSQGRDGVLPRATLRNALETLF